jgi:hypothetical protein
VNVKRTVKQTDGDADAHDGHQIQVKEEEILAGPWQGPIGSDIKSTIRQLEEIRADRTRRMEEKMKKKKF